MQTRRRELAIKAAKQHGACFQLACKVFRVSESCYIYERKLDAESEEIATWQMELADNNRILGPWPLLPSLTQLEGLQLEPQ
jgi:putative transposase